MGSTGVVLPSLACSRHLVLDPALLPSELTQDPSFSPSRAHQADMAYSSDFALKIQRL